jgi:hypothetical protein
MLKPTLIGGAVFGLLGGLPLISAINVCCCALIMGAGFLAAYLYSGECKKTGAEFRAGGGAKLGFVAGIFYWIVNSIVQGVASIVGGQPDFDEILDQAESQGAPPEVLDKMEQIFDVLGGPMGVMVLLGVGLVLALVFSTIGGLIGAAVFKVEAPPASPSGSSAPPPPVTPGSSV